MEDGQAENRKDETMKQIFTEKTNVCGACVITSNNYFSFNVKHYAIVSRVTSSK